MAEKEEMRKVLCEMIEQIEDLEKLKRLYSLAQYLWASDGSKNK